MGLAAALLVLLLLLCFAAASCLVLLSVVEAAWLEVFAVPGMPLALCMPVPCMPLVPCMRLQPAEVQCWVVGLLALHLVLVL